MKANLLFLDAKPLQEAPWMKTLWVYDLRTNQHLTLKTHPLRREHLDEFIGCCRPGKRHARVATWTGEPSDGRWRAFDYADLVKRDKANLDIFWLKDKSLEDAGNLPEPDVLAQEILDDLQSAMQQFAAVAAELATPRPREPDAP